MRLTLSTLRCPDSVPPETRSTGGGEFSLGRAPDNAWVLADPERHLSKRHCVLAFRGGAWQIADTSTNGTFLNRESQPIGQGQVRDLQDGDRIRLGAYEIEVRIEETADAPAPRQAPRGMPGANPFDDDPFAPPAPAFRPGPAAPPAPWGNEDPLLPPDFDPLAPSTPADPFGLPGGPPSIEPGTPWATRPPPQRGAPSSLFPADFDPLAPPAPDPFHGASVADHSPALNDAFRPPSIAPAPPSANPLPPDWDLDEPLLPPGATPPPGAPQGAPPPAPPPPAPPAFVAPPPPPPPPVAPPAAVPPPVAAPPAPAPPPMAAAPADGALLAAFLAGAGVPGARIEDPQATMAALGAAFRALVAGLRAVLIARAAIKGEFRIEQTMIRARGNNPLKFSADDDDALAALLGAGRRTNMGAAEAVTEALRDLRLHELASVAAMQTAVREMLAQLAPEAIQAQAGSGGLLPVQRKARAFEAYEAAHAALVQALSDDFDSAFGKAFARAYEEALREAAAKPEE